MTDARTIAALAELARASVIVAPRCIAVRAADEAVRATEIALWIAETCVDVVADTESGLPDEQEWTTSEERGG